MLEALFALLSALPLLAHFTTGIQQLDPKESVLEVLCKPVGR